MNLSVNLQRTMQANLVSWIQESENESLLQLGGVRGKGYLKNGELKNGCEVTRILSINSPFHSYNSYNYLYSYLIWLMHISTPPNAKPLPTLLSQRQFSCLFTAFFSFTRKWDGVI